MHDAVSLCSQGIVGGGIDSPSLPKKPLTMCTPGNHTRRCMEWKASTCLMTPCVGVSSDHVAVRKSKRRQARCTFTHERSSWLQSGRESYRIWDGERITNISSVISFEEGVGEGNIRKRRGRRNTAVEERYEDESKQEQDDAGAEEENDSRKTAEVGTLGRHSRW